MKPLRLGVFASLRETFAPLREVPNPTLGLAVALACGLLLTWLPLTDAAILFGLAALVIVTLVEPLAGLVGALFLGLLRAYIEVTLPRFPAHIGHFFVALAVASWLARKLAQRECCLLYTSPSPRDS